MNLRDACRAQAQSCRALGSPFTARLLDLVADRLTDDSAVGARLLSWEGDVSSNAQSVPLRIAGALHRLVLLGDEGLAPHWPPHETEDDALWSAVTGAFDRRGEEISRALDNAPQTNEVRRATALIPALHMLAAHYRRPLALLELGASAGLNLMLDRFALETGAGRFGPPDAQLVLSPEWKGPVPPAADVYVSSRRGVDVAPIDPKDPDDRLRLLSYIWADQPDRVARTTIAFDLAETRVETADAGEWLGKALASCPAEVLPVVYHTVAWQYFPKASQERALAAMTQAGATRPLARISMEGDGGQDAALTLTTWPEGRTRTLARVDFHGRWIDWTGPTSLN